MYSTRGACPFHRSEISSAIESPTDNIAQQHTARAFKSRPHDECKILPPQLTEDIITSLLENARIIGESCVYHVNIFRIIVEYSFEFLYTEDFLEN